MYVYAGTLLANRWKKAEGLKLAALEELTSSLPGTYAYNYSLGPRPRTANNYYYIKRKLGLGPRLNNSYRLSPRSLWGFET